MPEKIDSNPISNLQAKYQRKNRQYLFYPKTKNRPSIMKIGFVRKDNLKLTPSDNPILIIM